AAGGPGNPRPGQARPPNKTPPASRGGHRVENLTTRHRGNSRARQLPNAAISPCVSPSTKFYGKSRTRRFVPRTQFAVKFPWWCRRRRRMSADGDGFYTFSTVCIPPAKPGDAQTGETLDY